MQLSVFRDTLGRMRSRLYSRVTYLYHRLDFDEVESPGEDSSRVKRDRYDLLLSGSYPSESPRQSSGFKERAESRHIPSTVLYTLERDGEVAQWAWVVRFSDSHRLESMSSNLLVDASSAILVDGYTENGHRRQGLFEENLRTMLYDCEDESVRYVFCSTRAGNHASRTMVEKLGFLPFRLYTRTRLLGMERIKIESL